MGIGRVVGGRVIGDDVGMGGWVGVRVGAGAAGGGGMEPEIRAALRS